MKKLLGLFICFCILGSLQKLEAQDLHLSQYYAAPLNLNPALTGMINGAYRISGNHKRQWASVSNPYTSFIGAFDMPVKNWGLGVMVTSQTAGEIGYTDLSAMASASRVVSLGASGRSNLIFGLQGGLVQKSFSTNKITLDEQYNPNIGYDPSIQSSENFSNTQMTLPDFNFGAMYFYGAALSKVNPFLGASIFHLLEPAGTFTNSAYHLPRRYLVHGGLRLKLNKAFELTPHAIFITQKNAKELIIGLSSSFHFLTSDSYLLLGASYRMNDSAVPTIGFQIKDYTFGFSYDVNTSSLNKVSNYYGGYEISISYIPSKRVVEPKFICPRL